MRILGIDPGLQTTGFGLIDVGDDGQQLHYVASGIVRTTGVGLERGDLPARIGHIAQGVGEVVARWQPTVAVVEIVFVNVNPQSTLLLGQARGAALAALVTRDVSVVEYTALQMKKAITGRGRADKSQIQEMVRRMLNLQTAPGSDAADALGLAITHAHAARFMRQVDAHDSARTQRRQHAMLKAGRLY